MKRIPFIDLQRRTAAHAHEIERAVAKTLECCGFAGGPLVEQFESEFAGYCGSRHAIGVSNGTEALRLALTALGIGAGDEVITAPNSFFASASAIMLTGATPVFVDVDPQTGSIDPAKIEAAITSRTRAILPVHLYGWVAEMDAIGEIADRHGLAVVEDAAQAHGAVYHGRRAGSIGRLGCFSFYPTKNLGALGDAGAVVTDDLELAERICRLREHGQAAKNEHVEVGVNARMAGLQAAVLSERLPRLDADNERRRELAQRYLSRLGGLMDFDESQITSERHAHHLLVIQVDDRDGLAEALDEMGVGTGVYYPTPIHRQPAFRHLEAGPFPIAERRAERMLSLPLQPELRFDEIDFIIECVEQALAAHV